VKKRASRARDHVVDDLERGEAAFAIMVALQREPELIVLALRMPVLRKKIRGYLDQIEPPSKGTKGGAPSKRAIELRAFVRIAYETAKRLPGTRDQRCAHVAQILSQPLFASLFGAIDAAEVKRILGYKTKSQR
jgi:hypothetical protein